MRYYILILLIFGSLVGCTQEINQNESSDQKQSENPVTNPSEKKSSPSRKEASDYVPNPQVTDDRQLVQVGNTVSDEKGEAELKAYKKLEDRVKVGPVELTIKEVKVIHYRPSYSMVDFFHSYTHDETFDFVKVFVEVENTSGQALNFAPIAQIVTDLGEQRTWEEEIYLEELNGQFEPGEKKAGNLGFIIEKPDIRTFSITTSKVFDHNKKELNKEKVIKVEF